MIGGIDIRIAAKAGELSAEVAVRAIRQQWPSAVFENGLTGERFDGFWQIPFAEVEEMFIYRDSTAADIWASAGAVPEAWNSMIHIIVEPNALTVVIDDRDVEMESILQAIHSGLADEILGDPAIAEAA